MLRIVEKIEKAVTIETQTIAELFEPMLYEYKGQPDDEKENVVRFKSLQALLEKLTDPKAFRVGTEPEIPAYVVGKTSDGNWAGVKTALVET